MDSEQIKQLIEGLLKHMQVSVQSIEVPDSWYQGVIPFTDEVWSVTLSSGTTERISDISGKRGSPIDLVRPIISSDEKFLVFIDKGSETLWSLQMRE